MLTIGVSSVLPVRSCSCITKQGFSVHVLNVADRGVENMRDENSDAVDLRFPWLHSKAGIWAGFVAPRDSFGLL